MHILTQSPTPARHPAPTAPAPVVDVGFADTSAEHLRFSLDHERIVPLASHLVGLEAVADLPAELELHVIGSSHQVVLRTRGSDAFIETFACLGDETHPTTQRPEWGDVRTTSGTWAGFTRHEFRCSRQEVAGDFGCAVAEVLDRARAHTHHIVVGFPGNPDAVTALAATELAPGHLRWRTWHCYPQHRQIVHSASELSAGPPTGRVEMMGERS